MSDTIMDIKKVTTVLNILATKLGPINKLRVVKLLYFIDKIHLIDFGRLVTGDTYYRLPLGPAPTEILDIINNPKDRLFEDDQNYLFKYLEIKSGPKRTIHSIRKPDLSELSKSEIAVINRVVEEYGSYSLTKLLDRIHAEPAFKLANPSCKLLLENMISELPEERKKELQQLINEDKVADRVLLQLC